MRVGLGTTTHCPFLVLFNTKQGDQKNSAPETASSVNRHISWCNGPHRAAPCRLPGKFENLPGICLTKLCSRPVVSSQKELTEPDVLLAPKLDTHRVPCRVLTWGVSMNKFLNKLLWFWGKLVCSCVGPTWKRLERGAKQRRGAFVWLDWSRWFIRRVGNVCERPVGDSSSFQSLVCESLFSTFMSRMWRCTGTPRDQHLKKSQHTPKQRGWTKNLFYYISKLTSSVSIPLCNVLWRACQKKTRLFETECFFMNIKEKIELQSINETYCRRHGLKMIFSVLVTDGELSIIALSSLRIHGNWCRTNLTKGW